MTSHRLRNLVFFAISLLTTPSACADDTSELKGVVILTRHGVRATQSSPEELRKLSDRPWPEWSVKPGMLTAHGHRQMRLLGVYYREYLRREGLFTGDAGADAERAYFRANVYPRTIESAQALGEGLFPGRPVFVENYVGRGIGKDPVFDSPLFSDTKPDPAEIAASAARIDAPAAVESLRPQFRAVEDLLRPDGAPEPSAEKRWSNKPLEIKTEYGLPYYHGPITRAYEAVDNFTLQYAEGMPADKVGWGKVGPADIARLSRPGVEYIAMNYGAGFTAKVRWSFLGESILLTLERMKSGGDVAGAFGKAGDKLVVLAAHDSTVSGLGGLWGLRWKAPDGFAPGTILPGSALVFELRREKNSNRWFVRGRFAGQTLARIREGCAPSSESPLFTDPVAVKGCRSSGPQLDQPWEDFLRAARSEVDRRFIPPVASSNPYPTSKDVREPLSGAGTSRRSVRSGVATPVSSL